MLGENLIFESAGLRRLCSTARKTLFPVFTGDSISAYFMRNWDSTLPLTDVIARLSRHCVLSTVEFRHDFVFGWCHFLAQNFECGRNFEIFL